MEATDNRRPFRVELSPGAPVSWRVAENKFLASATSVSSKGLFIRTPEPPRAGTVLIVAFKCPLGEVRASATVKRVESGLGMGVEFLNMEDEDRERLTQFLKSLGG